MKVPIHKIPADFADRFPDGAYTIGRGADPRTVSGRTGDPVPAPKVGAEEPRKPKVKKRVTRPAAE